jgi:hypothetical protein
LCPRETIHDVLNSARHLQPERLVGYVHDSHGRSRKVDGSTRLTTRHR